MPQINLTDNRGRDAVVSTQSVSSPPGYRWIDVDGTQAENRKILRATIQQDESTLAAKAGGLDALSDLLISGDPEVDVEQFGRFLSETSRVYVNPEQNIVHHISHWEIVHDPEGNEKERRPQKVSEQNVATEIPLKWTGKLMKKADAMKRFVFSGKMQIQHVNGLTYDFLHSMAKELAASESLLLLGAGAKGSEPLTFRRGGLAYRGFLEGRVDGAKYALILHLSNQELKKPANTP
ncbi:MAG: hypothetical protein IAE77_03675 [Prosthecobacter sp.]|jgi:hypothetical protein|uniref:hypothetical protein n=1 Tax=Prosthecobacter sp. TaxID=1965333 RepID=UPI0019FFAE70|nr:hypothetical protein [Prosthecobacter sp.]MBE2282544.1 hypothetical protein [Prosthecobacter sp.]